MLSDPNEAILAKVNPSIAFELAHYGDALLCTKEVFAIMDAVRDECRAASTPTLETPHAE